MKARSLFLNGKYGFLSFAVSVSSIFVFAHAHADTLPDCMSNGQVLEVNNDQVVLWKSSTPDQFRARAHVQGPLINIYPDQTGHHHLEVKIGTSADATIEVIYNEEFGPMPALELNQTIEACGDYITSKGISSSYPASPDGAIVHWVHYSPSPRHDSGYVAVDGVPYGQDGVHLPKKKH